MKGSSIQRNFAYQMVYEVLVLLLPFVTSPYIARVIGAEGLGTYSYSFSVAYYFVLFSHLGIKNYGNRAVAQARDDLETLSAVFCNIYFLHLLISVACCVAYVGYVFALRGEKIYALIQGLYVISGLLDISWFYFGIERFKLTVIRDGLIKLLNVGCIFIFVRNSNDLWKYCLIMSSGQLISQLALWIPLRKYIRLIRPSWGNMKTHVKPLFILFIPAVAVSLYKYMDKIMIGAMSSKTELGFYENAEKIINIPMTIITSFGTVMLPKMSNLAVSSDRKVSERYMTLSMEFVMCLAMALSCGLAAVGPIFAPVFWGSEFAFSGDLIRGLSITVPFIAFANVIRTQYLIPWKKDREYLTSVVLGSIINLIINVLLIPKYGSIGAAIGTVAAEISVCLIQSFAVKKELPLFLYLKSFFYFVLLGILMFIVVSFIGNIMGISLFTLAIQVMVGAVLYGGLTFLYLLYEKNEIIMRIIRNKVE